MAFGALKGPGRGTAYTREFQGAKTGKQPQRESATGGEHPV